MKQINWGRIGCGNVTEVNEFESSVVSSGELVLYGAYVSLFSIPRSYAFIGPLE